MENESKIQVRTGFQMSHVFFVLKDLRWEVVVHFVDSGEIVDSHRLNFLSIIRNFTKNKDYNIFLSLLKNWSPINKYCKYA